MQRPYVHAARNSTRFSGFTTYFISDPARPELKKIYDLPRKRIVVNLAAPNGKIIKVIF